MARFETLTPDLIVAAMASDNPEERWAAVIVVRQKKLRLVPSLIDLLGDPEKLVPQEAQLALVQLAKGADPGPNDNAAAAEVAESVRQWKQWWQRNSEKATAQKRQLAKKLLIGNPGPARQRLEEVANQFPGTAAAKEAEKLLDR